MKTINEYIEDLSPGDTIPAIKGEVVQITPPKDDSTTQVVIIQSEQRIKLYIKSEDLHIPDGSVGSVLSAASGKTSKGISGLTLKHNTSDKPYITVSSGAVISVEKRQEDDSSVTEEPMTDADHKIKAYIEDRLYIYNRAIKMVREYNAKQEDLSDTFPVEKVAELTTGTHMFMEKSGHRGRIAPTHTARVRKELHQEKAVKSSVTEKPKKKEAPEEGADKSKTNWRDYKHPKSGERLGDVSIEKIKTQLAPWYYRTSPHSLAPETLEYHYYIGQAIQGHKLTPSEIINAYLEHYAKSAFPHSAKLKTEAIVKFCKGLLDANIIKGDILDDYELTLDEMLAIIRDFKELWTNLVEGESSDE
jgi:hypothetical protein